eukprot:scaffold3045_cov271-Chaetoceros_neogracile.AAC.5
MSFAATRVLPRPTAIFLNSARLNYDKKLDYSRTTSDIFHLSTFDYKGLQTSYAMKSTMSHL